MGKASMLCVRLAQAEKRLAGSGRVRGTGRENRLSFGDDGKHRYGDGLGYTSASCGTDQEECEPNAL